MFQGHRKVALAVQSRKWKGLFLLTLKQHSVFRAVMRSGQCLGGGQMLGLENAPGKMD